MRRGLLLGTLLSASAFAASPNPYLAQAQTLYEGLDFERCVQRLDQAARWENSRPELVAIELYQGLCKSSLGRNDEAKDHFVLALELDPAVALPKLTSPKIQELFAQAKAEVSAHPRAVPPAPPLEAPKATASAPPPSPNVATAPPPSIDLRSSPPTQPRTHRWTGPVLLFGVAAAATTGGVLFGLQAQRLEAAAPRAYWESDGLKLAGDARRTALFANVSYGAALTAAIAAATVYLASTD